MKTPLSDKYRFKSTKILKEVFPKGSIIESYLLYSGAIEVDLALSDRFVIAHTNKYPTYEFWWMAKNRPHRVSSLAESVFQTIPEPMLYKFQENWFEQRDPFYRSALYYILNRCSDIAGVSCGSISKAALRPYSFTSFKKLQLDNFYVLLDKFDDICECPGNSSVNSDFKFFPAGAFSLNLLQAEDLGSAEEAAVNHHRLYKMLESADYRWATLYKFHKRLIKKYKNYNIIMIDKYGNRTAREDSCEDVIVTNF